MWAMTSPRRRGTETSKTRFLLLGTAERLMLEEGYAPSGSGGWPGGFTALSNQRKAIRQEPAAYAERFRDARLRVLDGHLRERGDTGGLHPLAG